MEFLAESIGLLDIDGGAYATPDPQRRPNETVAVESNGAAAADSYVPSVLSFSFFNWGEKSDQSNTNNVDDKEDKDERVDCDGDCFAAVNEEDISPGKSALRTDGDFQEEGSNREILDTTNHGEGGQRGDLDQGEAELAISSMSLLSTLTPASPLTLSASSLNLLSERDFSSDGRDADSDSCYCHKCQKQHCSCESDEGENDDTYAEPTNIFAIPTKTIVTSSVENVLTKHVTQRIDARTNYDCFTGNVDAVTGHLLHGTMLYRQTGTVYEGTFITTQGQYNEGAGDTVSLRHGENATCSYPNGMKFIGSFELDHPKAGTWIGGDWSYEGPLVVVQEGKTTDAAASDGADCDSKGDNSSKYGSFGSHPISHRSLSTGSDMSNNNMASDSQQCSLRVIGIPHPLPGSVLFHGKGRFARSDGLVYEGEFLHGLANGVGKEILPNGCGVYQGEFADGLRHGVGTLMEDYVDKSICNCHFEEVQEGGSNGRLQSRPALIGNDCTTTLRDASDSNESSEGNVNNNQSIDPGPDFAAGCMIASTDDIAQNATTPGVGSSSLTPPTTSNGRLHNETTQTPKQCQKCHLPTTTRKQRYSSGVWCAGQYEIEDCRGTVHPHNNEFTEESRAVASTIAATGNDGGFNTSKEVSLNRTTWDMLDEKWLGI